MAAPVVDDFSDIKADARGTAKQQAKTALREKNKGEWQCDLTTIGNPRMAAGMTFMVEGFGVFDGKYIADTVSHTIGDNGYETQIQGHRVLEGY